ncbi:hypothetical protein B484DRAFT_427452 [Ochromonadaceae sp. CCMP2298]|nr:hypothetical protein B484DRAFT_427452 [Ochromonadaceae sp. CCMP2298]
MGLDKSMRKIPVPEIMEDARKKLVSALKYGYPFVVAMTTSVTDFATCFNDASATSLGLDTHDGQMYLPQALLQQGGQLLLEEKFLEGLFRKEDREGGVAYCRSPDTFQVILTTRFALEDFDEYLFGNTWGLPRPRENYAVIVIQEEAP